MAETMQYQPYRFIPPKPGLTTPQGFSDMVNPRSVGDEESAEWITRLERFQEDVHQAGIDQRFSLSQDEWDKKRSLSITAAFPEAKDNPPLQTWLKDMYWEIYTQGARGKTKQEPHEFTDALRGLSQRPPADRSSAIDRQLLEDSRWVISDMREMNLTCVPNAFNNAAKAERVEITLDDLMQAKKREYAIRRSHGDKPVETVPGLYAGTLLNIDQISERLNAEYLVLADQFAPSAKQGGGLSLTDAINRMEEKDYTVAVLCPKSPVNDDGSLIMGIDHCLAIDISEGVDRPIFIDNGGFVDTDAMYKWDGQIEILIGLRAKDENCAIGVVNADGGVLTNTKSQGKDIENVQRSFSTEEDALSLGYDVANNVNLKTIQGDLPNRYRSGVEIVHGPEPPGHHRIGPEAARWMYDQAVWSQVGEKKWQELRMKANQPTAQPGPDLQGGTRQIPAGQLSFRSVLRENPPLPEEQQLLFRRGLTSSASSTPNAPPGSRQDGLRRQEQALRPRLFSKARQDMPAESDSGGRRRRRSKASPFARMYVAYE